MKKVALYARQSIEKEGSLSIEGQLERCRSKLLPNEEYLEFRDAGFSGKDMNRPQFQEMMRLVTTRQISKIVVWKLDRYSRSIINFWDNYKILQEYEVEFVSVEEEFISNKGQMGKLMTSILVSFAEMERENIRARVKSSYMQRTKERGSWPGGPAPFGFTIGKLEGTKIPTLVPNEKALECVRYMYETYAQGHTSLGALGKYLAQNEFYGRNGKTYDNSAISRILHNPIYVSATQDLYDYFRLQGVEFLNSREEWDGTTSCHLINKRPNQSSGERQRKPLSECSVYLTNIQGIVEPQFYIQCQYNMSKNKQLKNTGKGKLGFLGGLLKCKNCGRSIKCYNYPYLRCWGKAVAKNCDLDVSKKITIPSLQSYVADYIQEELNIWKNYTSQCQEEVATYQQRIQTLQDEIDNLLDFVASDRNYFAMAKKRMDEKTQEIEELKSLIESIQGNTSISENIIFSELSEDEKFDIAHTLIDKIYLDYGDQIIIIPNKNNGRHIVNMDKYQKALLEENTSTILPSEIEEEIEKYKGMNEYHPYEE